MNKEIYLNKEEINRILESLKKAREKLVSVIEKQKSLHTLMHGYWSGTSGDKAYSTLSNHEKMYEKYLSSLDARIKFLENAMNKYFELDAYLIKKEEEYGNGSR